MKKLKTAIASLIIGLIGSILFEFWLKDLLTYVASVLTVMIRYFMDNAYYAYIPSGISSIQSKSYICLIMFFALLIIAPPKFLFNMFHKTPSNRRDMVFHTSFQICCVLILFFNLSLDIAISGDANHMLRKIEIVSPYISEFEYKELKSNFYQIDSKDDYNSLNHRIEEIAQQYDLNVE